MALLSVDEIDDGMESLQYWHDRSRRLPWYRRSARREARAMAERWERRVAAAVVSQRGVPMRMRASGAVLVAGTRIQRLRIGRWVRVAAVSLMLMLALPFLLLAFVLSQIF